MIPGIIPASGASSRMGSPKALLDGGGRSFLERVGRALVDGGCAPLLVVVLDERSPIAAMARTLGAHVVENPDPEEGPITSLQRGIEALPPEVEGCVFCPVDHPLVAATTVTALIDAFRNAASPGTGHAAGGASSRTPRGFPPPVVVPTHGGTRGHPVLFAAHLFPELLAEGLEEGARTVVHRHLDEIVEVPVADPGVLVDIDTVPEYRRHFPDSFRKRFQSR